MVPQYFRGPSLKQSDMSLGRGGQTGGVVDRTVSSPRRRALLIPAACDSAISHGQRDTADVNKLKILSWRDGWAPVRQGSY